MKKLIISVILILVSLTVFSQQEIIPLKEFKGDTLAFIQENFNTLSSKFNLENTTLFLDEMETKGMFTYFTIELSQSKISNNYRVFKIVVYYYNKKQLKACIDNKKSIYAIVISFDWIYSEGTSQFQEFQKIGFNKLIKWDKEKHYKVLKGIGINSVETEEYSEKTKEFYKNTFE